MKRFFLCVMGIFLSSVVVQAAPVQQSKPLYGLGLNNLTQDSQGRGFFGSSNGVSQERQRVLGNGIREGSTKYFQPDLELSMRGRSEVDSSVGQIAAILSQVPDGAPVGWEAPNRVLVFTIISTYGEESKFLESRGVLSSLLGVFGVKIPKEYVYSGKNTAQARVIILDLAAGSVPQGRYLYYGFKFQPVMGEYSETSKKRFEVQFGSFFNRYGFRTGKDRDVDPAFIMAVAMNDAIEKASPQLEKVASCLSRN